MEDLRWRCPNALCNQAERPDGSIEHLPSCELDALEDVRRKIGRFHVALHYPSGVLAGAAFESVAASPDAQKVDAAFFRYQDPDGSYWLLILGENEASVTALGCRAESCGGRRAEPHPSAIAGGRARRWMHLVDCALRGVPTNHTTRNQPARFTTAGNIVPIGGGQG